MRIVGSERRTGDECWRHCQFKRLEYSAQCRVKRRRVVLWQRLEPACKAATIGCLRVESKVERTHVHEHVVHGTLLPVRRRIRCVIINTNTDIYSTLHLQLTSVSVVAMWRLQCQL